MEETKSLKSITAKESEKIVGGTFNKVVIRGKNIIEKDIKCKSFLVDGVCKLKGNLEAKSIVIKGQMSIDKSVSGKNVRFGGIVNVKENCNIEDLTISGKALLEKDIICKELNIAGSASIDGNVESSYMYVSGVSYLKGNLKVDKLALSGGLIAEKSIKGSNINITLGTESKINNLKGKNITVKNPENTAKLFSKMLKKLVKNKVQLSCKKIEGDKIYLENTTADLVRGNVVIIGEGCNIKKVEYIEELKVIENGKVIKNIKVD